MSIFNDEVRPMKEGETFDKVTDPEAIDNSNPIDTEKEREDQEIAEAAIQQQLEKDKARKKAENEATEQEAMAQMKQAKDDKQERASNIENSNDAKPKNTNSRVDDAYGSDAIANRKKYLTGIREIELGDKEWDNMYALGLISKEEHQGSLGLRTLTKSMLAENPGIRAFTNVNSYMSLSAMNTRGGKRLAKRFAKLQEQRGKLAIQIAETTNEFEEMLVDRWRDEIKEIKDKDEETRELEGKERAGSVAKKVVGAGIFATAITGLGGKLGSIADKIKAKFKKDKEPKSADEVAAGLVNMADDSYSEGVSMDENFNDLAETIKNSVNNVTHKDKNVDVNMTRIMDMLAQKDKITSELINEDTHNDFVTNTYEMWDACKSNQDIDHDVVVEIKKQLEERLLSMTEQQELSDKIKAELDVIDDELLLEYTEGKYNIDDLKNVIDDMDVKLANRIEDIEIMQENIYNEMKVIIETSELAAEKNTAEVSEENTAEVSEENTAEVSEENTAEVSEENTAEVSEENTAEVSEENTAEVSEENTAEVSEENTAEVSEENTAEVSEENTAEVSEENTAEVSEENIAEVSEENTAEVSEKDTAESIEEITEQLEKNNEATDQIIEETKALISNTEDICENAAEKINAVDNMLDELSNNKNSNKDDEKDAENIDIDDEYRKRMEEMQSAISDLAKIVHEQKIQIDRQKESLDKQQKENKELMDKLNGKLSNLSMEQDGIRSGVRKLIDVTSENNDTMRLLKNTTDRLSHNLDKHNHDAKNKEQELQKRIDKLTEHDTKMAGIALEALDELRMANPDAFNKLVDENRLNKRELSNYAKMKAMRSSKSEETSEETLDVSDKTLGDSKF